MKEQDLLTALKIQHQSIELDIIRVEQEITELKSECFRLEPSLASREAAIRQKCARLSRLKK
jgi:hypothetical protein